MNTDPSPVPPPDSEPGRHTALFANLVLQHSQLALLLMGQGPRPEGAPEMVDLEHARLLVDQLEMLEAKTKGHLNPTESGLLKSTLTTLRMAYVQAASQPPQSAARPDAPPPADAVAKVADQPASQPPQAEAQPTPTATPPPPAPPDEAAAAADEGRKKFVKRY